MNTLRSIYLHRRTLCARRPVNVLAFVHHHLYAFYTHIPSVATRSLRTYSRCPFRVSVRTKWQIWKSGNARRIMCDRNSAGWCTKLQIQIITCGSRRNEQTNSERAADNENRLFVLLTVGAILSAWHFFFFLLCLLLLSVSSVAVCALCPILRGSDTPSGRRARVNRQLLSLAAKMYQYQLIFMSSNPPFAVTGSTMQHIDVQAYALSFPKSFRFGRRDTPDPLIQWKRIKQLKLARHH